MFLVGLEDMFISVKNLIKTFYFSLEFVLYQNAYWLYLEVYSLPVQLIDNNPEDTLHIPLVPILLLSLSNLFTILITNYLSLPPFSF